MSNPISSPGDPIFYLHHTWLDKVWWDWQAQNLSARLTAMGGQNTQSTAYGFTNNVEGINNGTLGNGTCTPNSVFNPCTSDPLTILGDDGGNVTTLNHVLSTLGVVPNVTIADVMDIGGDYLCYEYVDADDEAPTY